MSDELREKARKVKVLVDAPRKKAVQRRLCLHATAGAAIIELRPAAEVCEGARPG